MPVGCWFSINTGVAQEASGCLLANAGDRGTLPPVLPGTETAGLVGALRHGVWIIIVWHAAA